jgi:hypothetical protein
VQYSKLVPSKGVVWQKRISYPRRVVSEHIKIRNIYIFCHPTWHALGKRFLCRTAKICRMANWCHTASWCQVCVSCKQTFNEPTSVTGWRKWLITFCPKIASEKDSWNRLLVGSSFGETPIRPQIRLLLRHTSRTAKLATILEQVKDRHLAES